MNARQINHKYSRTVKRQVIRIVSNMISLDQVKQLEAAGFVVVMVIQGGNKGR
jgi:hypothetical protein